MYVSVQWPIFNNIPGEKSKINSIRKDIVTPKKYIRSSSVFQKQKTKNHMVHRWPCAFGTEQYQCVYLLFGNYDRAERRANTGREISCRRITFGVLSFPVSSGRWMAIYGLGTSRWRGTRPKWKWRSVRCTRHGVGGQRKTPETMTCVSNGGWGKGGRCAG